MATCGSCFGSGKISCSTCHGRGMIHRLDGNGNMDMSPCAVCGGTKKMRCYVCGGRGTVGPSIPQPLSPPRGSEKPSRPTDILAGRWTAADGGFLQITKRGKAYDVGEFGAIGQTGTGTATLNGNTVTLDINNVLLGRYSYQLVLNGNSMSGTIIVFGIPAPLMFYRG